MNEHSSFEISQDYDVVPLERGRVYLIPTKEWQYLKDKIRNIGDRPNVYFALGLLLLGAALTTFIQCIAGDFPKTPEGNIPTQHVIWWASFAVCLITGLLSLFFGIQQKGLQTVKSDDLVEYMEQIEERFIKTEKTAFKPQKDLLFDDNFENFADWEDYKGGTLLLSNDFQFQGVSCLKKDRNNDPSGGFKLLKTQTSLDLLFSGWIYRPLQSSGGKGNRLAIEDEAFNGYGFLVHHNSKPEGSKFAVIERRGEGQPTDISKRVTFKTDKDDWYKFDFFIRSKGEHELVISDLYGKELVRVKSQPDTHFNSFDRVVVHGGYEYYLAELKVEPL